MIVPTEGKVGVPVEFTGYASDYDRRITAIQFSMDDGKTWTTYDTSDTTSERWVHWSFIYTPQTPGYYRLKVRAINENGDVTPLADTADLIVE